MDVETAETPHATTGSEGRDPSSREEESDWYRANRGGFRRLIASTVRLANIQLKIWVIETKITAARVLFFLILFGAAAVISLLALIFLLIGMFKILTDEIGIAPVWAYLIFGAFLLAVAGAIAMVGKNALNKKLGAGERKSG